jgi:hypothetical protein
MPVILEGFIYTTMSNSALGRIEDYFDFFCYLYEKHKGLKEYKPKDIEGLYASLYRVKERYLAEQDRLLIPERDALSKVFEYDNFIKGIMNIRLVAEHAKRNKNYEICYPNNSSILLTPQTSPHAMFCGHEVIVEDCFGGPHKIEHIKFLDEAQFRIKRAIKRAKKEEGY